MNLNLDSKIKFNIAHIKLCTKVEGPFKRCCIWFQGCDINCKGCCNKDLASFTIKNILSLEELVKIVIDAKEKYNIEGITLSGGEPSLQKGLTTFNEIIHDLGLGIIMFSGKYLSNLDRNLIQSCDLIIDGPFIIEQYDSKRMLIGSKNKRLDFITDRYKKYADYFYNDVSEEEVDVSECIFINGD